MLTLKITLPLSSPKHFLLLTVFASQWFSGKRRKRNNHNEQIKLAISRHQPGHGSDASLLSLIRGIQRNYNSEESGDIFLLCTSWLSVPCPHCHSTGSAGSRSSKRLVERMDSTHFHCPQAVYQLFEDLSRSNLVLFSELCNDCWWHQPTTGSTHWWVL